MFHLYKYYAMYLIVRRRFTSGQVYFSVYSKSGALVFLTKKSQIAEKLRLRLERDTE